METILKSFGHDVLKDVARILLDSAQIAIVLNQHSRAKVLIVLSKYLSELANA